MAKIARHFGLKGVDRRALRQLLKEMQVSGALGRRGRKRLAESGSLPPVVPNAPSNWLYGISGRSTLTSLDAGCAATS